MVSDSAVRVFLLEFCLTRPTLTFNVVTGGQLEAMKPHDQLTKQRLRKTAFADFEEGPLSFWPTYKYDNGTDDFDSPAKHRASAWTDRILSRAWTCGGLAGPFAASAHRPSDRCDSIAFASQRPATIDDNGGISIYITCSRHSGTLIFRCLCSALLSVPSHRVGSCTCDGSWWTCSFPLSRSTGADAAHAWMHGAVRILRNDVGKRLAKKVYQRDRRH